MKNYSIITDWSPYSILGDKVKYSDKYKLVKIGNFLQRNKTKVVIQDSNIYKRPTIRLYNAGVFVRDEVQGIMIGTKNQFIISKGQFLLSKIDARNGAFGVVPDDCDNAIITGNFWTFDVNYSIINPFFLNLLTSTKVFHQYCQSASVGTTNRNYLQEIRFLNTKIPLPPLETQNKLVDDYNKLVNLAIEQEAKSKQLEQDIENYLLSELGIKIQKSEIKKGIQFVRFKDISRWDYEYNFGTGKNIFKAFNKSNYNLINLGNIYNFINRSWNKKEHPSNSFNYIEIGSVESGSNDINYTELFLDKAPSRATQIVKTNDLIIGLTRPYLKKFVVVDKKYNEFICSSGFQVIEQNSNYNLVFLLEYLFSEAAIKQFEILMAGALYPAITSSDFKKVLIPLPPLEKQNEIVEKIESMRKEIKKLKHSAEQNRKQAKQNFESEIFG